jgi:hypothetical protein
VITLIYSNIGASISANKNILIKGKALNNQQLTKAEFQSLISLEKTNDLNLQIEAKFARISISDIIFHSTSYCRKNRSVTTSSENISFNCHQHSSE